MNRLEAEQFRAKIEQASAWTDDADALEMVELFPKWKEGKSVIVGERLQYKADGCNTAKLYKCLQAHTTQSGWTPDVTPALWREVSVDEFPAWIQPTGAADAYQTGNKVSHNDKHWISTCDNNVWEPSVYGWSEV